MSIMGKYTNMHIMILGVRFLLLVLSINYISILYRFGLAILLIKAVIFDIGVTVFVLLSS